MRLIKVAFVGLIKEKGNRSRICKYRKDILILVGSNKGSTIGTIVISILAGVHHIGQPGKGPATERGGTGNIIHIIWDKYINCLQLHDDLHECTKDTSDDMCLCRRFIVQSCLDYLAT